MQGATELEDGTAGLVPTPTKEDSNKYLRGDGTWSVPAGAEDVFELQEAVGDPNSLNDRVSDNSSIVEEINALKAKMDSLPTIDNLQFEEGDPKDGEAEILIKAGELSSAFSISSESLEITQEGTAININLVWKEF